uniref:ABC1 atypical kinase-like domain-containing protein n=1 Tax=Aegilops tauschii subsp. strangulata TaxID=200361 RepID=A0A452Y8U0_AEGTS
MAASTSATAGVSFSLPSHPRRLRRRPSLLRAASTAAPPSPDLSIQLSPRPSPRASPPVVPSLARDRAEDLQAESRAMTRAAAATVYTPELLASRYGSQPFQVAMRAAEVLSKLGAFGLKLLLDQQRGESSSSAKRRARAVELRTVLTRLGPTFVKIGQGLSTRPDLCPTEYLEELSELQVDLLTCRFSVLMIRNYCWESTE